MKQAIITKRLTLRQLTAEDFPEYLEYELDPTVMAHIREVGTEQEIQEHYNGYLADWLGEENVWMGAGVTLTETGKLIGDLGFRYRDKRSEIIEIGYKFNSRYHGCGYATEALTAFLEMIETEWPVHKLVAYADPENIPSVRLMEKMGLVKEGHFVSHYKIGDLWTDEVAYGKVL